MIQVDRSKFPPPERLVEPDSVGMEETKEALEFYSDVANHQEKFEFDAYRHSDVKELLVKLFHGKCAYCEGSVSSSQDGDIEHFRPKGAVEIGGQPTKPGYFWLAAAWPNLFLSCQHCNQTRKHREDGAVVVKAGKASKFPLADEAQRVGVGDLPADLVDGAGELDLERLLGVCENEARLLLDPCEDDPHRHLRFLEDCMVLATTDDQGEPDAKGHASIHTFGLHRPQLVNDRAAELVKIQDALDLIRSTVEGLDEDPGNALTRRLLEQMLINLETHCHPRHRFSGMARQVVDRFMADLLA